MDENGSPAIVGYKRGVDAGVIDQGLFYLAWLMDRRAEFEHLVRGRLGVTAASQVRWGGPRLSYSDSRPSTPLSTDPQVVHGQGPHLPRCLGTAPGR
ncbi:hypothetical protein HY68_38295 [Streptomyces sp. AcH 505]|nr:hypothetical protein HY68_38295 [Streptomyces sp. AcH 505]